MVTQNNSTSVQDLSTQCVIGARIIYRHAKPYGFSEIVATGEIIGIADHCGQTQIQVKPAADHLITKWLPVTVIKTYPWKV